MADIGLKAVMDMVGFTQGINKYNEMVGNASSNTDKHANLITKAFAGIGSAVKIGIAAGAAGVATLTTAIVASTTAAVSWAEKIDSVGDVLGTTAQESSALAVAAQHIGGNVEQLTAQMAKLTMGLTDAKGEIGPTGKVLQGLGISFKDANGKMLPTTQILGAVATKIAAMPDGLEKTQLMMDLFGKSGKDMSDMLGALANGGMEQFDQMAKDMGLSMTDEAAAGAIEFNRSLNDLKMMLQGFAVQVGTAFLPVMQTAAQMIGDVLPIALNFLRDIFEKIQPIVQAVALAFRDLLKTGDLGLFLDNIHEGLAGLVPESVLTAIDKVVLFIRDKFIPALKDIWGFIKDSVIPILSDVVVWLAQNLPPAIGTVIEWLGKNLLPVIKDVWAFIKDPLIPIIGDIIVWLATNLPPAIRTAIEWFKTNLLPVLTDIYEFIRDKVVPVIGDIVTWLVDHIPPAISTAITWFKEHLLPTIYDIWNFFYNKILPVLADVANFLIDNIGRAITTSVTFWKEKLWPAINDIWDVITNKVIPAISDVITWLGDKLIKPIGTVVGGALTNLKNIFIDIKGAISDVIGFLKDVIDWANTAIGKLKELLGLQGQSGSGIPGSTGSTHPQDFMGSVGATNTLPGNTGGNVIPGNVINISMPVTINSAMDLAMFRELILTTVREALA